MLCETERVGWLQRRSAGELGREPGSGCGPRDLELCVETLVIKAGNNAMRHSSIGKSGLPLDCVG